MSNFPNTRKSTKKKTKLLCEMDLKYLRSTGIAIFPHVNTSTTFNIEYDNSNKKVTIKDSSNNTLLTITGDSKTPVLNNGAVDVWDNKEQYYVYVDTSSLPNAMNFNTNYVYAIFVTMIDNNKLTVTGPSSKTSIGEQSFTFGASSSIVVENGSLLVIGGSSMILSSSGYKVNSARNNIELDDTITYSKVEGNDITLGSSGICSHNSIIMGSGSTMTVKKSAIVHVGASVYGNGKVTLSDNANLTIGSDDEGDVTYLNIGASNNKSTDNTLEVSGTCVIKNSWVNLGGSCGAYNTNRIVDAGVEGGSKGTLTINAATIDKSRIYCGSGCGTKSGAQKHMIGGNGTLTVNSNITNSIIYLGGAGAYCSSTSYEGTGGDGSLTVGAEISNSIVLVGSSGSYGTSVAGGGQKENGGYPGCNGTLETDGSTTGLSNTIISIGLPSIDGPDANINAKVGKIEHSVVFCGTGNYGSGDSTGGGVSINNNIYMSLGGAAGYNRSSYVVKAACVAISGFHEGYLGQQPSLVFNTMTPGVLTLPFAPSDGSSQSFSAIGEFPRVDNRAWSMTEQKTIDISTLGIKGIVDNRTTKSGDCVFSINGLSGNIVADKFTNFGGIIVNPNEEIPSKTLNENLIRVSDESIDIISKDFNNSVIVNQLKCGLIVNNTKPFYINPSNLVVDNSVTLDSSNPFSIKPSKNSLVNFSTTDSTIKSSGTLSIDGQATFNKCELSNVSTIKSTNASIDSCQLSNTNIQSNRPVTFLNTNLTGFEVGASESPLRFPLKMDNCELVQNASKITNATTTNKNTLLTIVDSTIKKVIEVNNDTVNVCIISGCTFNDDITTGSLHENSTITNCEFGSGVNLSFVSNMEDLTVNGDGISYISETSGSTTNNQVFTVRINNIDTTLGDIKLQSPTTIKPISTLIITNQDSNPETNPIILSGNYSTNIRNQLVTEKGIPKSDISLVVDNKSSVFLNFSLGTDSKMLFENGETYKNVTIADGMSVSLNANIDFIDFTKEGDLTVLSSNCEEVSSESKQLQNSKIIQNNVTINSLKHYKGSVLKYDNTEFLINSLTLYDKDTETSYQLQISNNSLTNLSSSKLSFTSNFVIGNTEVLASEAHPFTLKSGATCQFIGAGTYTPTESEYDTTTFLQGKPLTISNGYLLLTTSETDPLDFSGFALKIGSKTIDIRGHLKIDNTMSLKIESDITIPEDTTLEINTEANAKVILKGNVKFIGDNIVKIDNVVVQKADETVPREIVVDFGTDDGMETTFNNTSLNATIITNTGTIDLTNSVANFGDFVNNGIFTMISSKTTNNTTLGISNSGTTTWFNAEINAVDNGTLSITNGSSICPRNGLIGPHLSFVGNFSVGSLNLSQDGVLHIQGKASDTRFDGSLQINTVVYLGDSTQTIPPISSENANTSLIINSDKYTLSNPFRGQLLMGATDGNVASLQINSSGLIDIPKDSIFKVWSNVTSQKAVVNGIFKSTIGGKTFEYNDNMTLNGTIEMERDVIVKGKLQITSNGKLYIGQAAGVDDIPEGARVMVVTGSNVGSSTPYIITFTNFDIMPSTQLIKTVSTIEGESVTSYNVVSTDSSKRIIPISVKVDASNNASITYSNGVILKLSYDDSMDIYILNTFTTVSGDSPNVFFGSHSDVYISNLLEIFGTFYNNKKLTVNARLTCVAGSSIINNGTISVRSDNDNAIVGNILVGNLGALTFNGTYNDHSKFNLVINERSGFVVNDSIIISSTTNEIDVLANSEPQIHTVLVNYDIVTTKPHYIIKPKQDDTKASTYTSLTDVKPIDDYAI